MHNTVASDMITCDAVRENGAGIMQCSIFLGSPAMGDSVVLVNLTQITYLPWDAEDIWTVYYNPDPYISTSLPFPSLTQPPLSPWNSA